MNIVSSRALIIEQTDRQTNICISCAPDGAKNELALYFCTTISVEQHMEREKTASQHEEAIIRVGVMPCRGLFKELIEQNKVLEIAEVSVDETNFYYS